MLPPIPRLADYQISASNGFLPDSPPLAVLPDIHYRPWEQTISNLQALILAKRIRQVVDQMPVLSTSRLRSDAERRRAYVILSFLTHAYIWTGERPCEIVPESLSVPYLKVTRYLEVPPVASYAAVCLWNYRPIFDDEPIDILENLATLHTFTGSLDESWFYLVSVAIEARAAPTLPLMMRAVEAARQDDVATVTRCLQSFAERIDELGSLLMRMTEMCDPHAFYFRIRPFLAGSKNMAEAGLPRGVKYLDGSGTEEFQQYSGGSNAQSSLLQAFDIILGIQHRPTGETKENTKTSEKGYTPMTSSKHNFIQEMRKYMPGPHRRFLEDLTLVANIREFVESHNSDRTLTVAYDACLCMLRTFRDKHIQIVSRYIIIQAKDSRKHESAGTPANTASANDVKPVVKPLRQGLAKADPKKGALRGTGGTALIPFLKQARDETGEPSIGTWAKRYLSNKPSSLSTDQISSDFKIQGLAEIWLDSEEIGGICHW